MISKYKTIIWDWNGTLYDDAHFCRGITDSLLRKRGISLVDDETHQRQFCHPIRDYYRNIGVDFEKHDYEAISIEFVREYEANAHTLSLRDGAREILQYLQSNGARQLILSAAPVEYIKKTVEFQGLNDHFDVVIGQDNYYGVGKLETAQAWAASQGETLENAVLIGDTDHDFEVASSIGVDCILIPSGYQHRDNLLECGVHVISSLTELT